MRAYYFNQTVDIVSLFDIEIPSAFVFHAPYLNPFNPSITIRFDLPEEGIVSLIVYDIQGREVTILMNEYRNTGSYEMEFDGSDLASGIYIFRLNTNDFTASGKMVMVK